MGATWQGDTILPISATSGSIGSASLYWSAVYAVNFIGESTSSVSVTNVTASNTVQGNTNVIAGTGGETIGLQGTGAGRIRLDWSGSTDSNVSLDLVQKGNGAVQLPRIANASLLSCTASTEDATHVQESALAEDSTNHQLAFCNGTSWLDIPTSSDWFDSAYDPLTTLTTGDFAVSGPTTNATTLRHCNFTNPVAGGGTGNETIKVCTVAGCGSGTTFATFTIAGNASAATNTTCTINTAAIPAGTTLHYAITANATTANVAGNIKLQGTTP